MTPPLIITPFAASGDQSVLPPTDPNGFVNFTNGYTPDYEINLSSGDPQAKAVERGIQNYLFNMLTSGMQAWQNANRPPWYSSMPGGYRQYAEVVMVTTLDGPPTPFRSLVDGNVSTPGSSTTWEYIEGTGELIANVPMPSGGPLGPGSMLISSSTDFNTFVNSGTYQFATDAIVAGSPRAPSNGGNIGGAGMLEVTAWTGSATAYVSQFYRDRSGLGFMRGAANGNWTAWKIWANATQFVIGEVRDWYGTNTEAAVQAAWGPGWHLCNGANGTPDLRDKFIIGAGTNAVGSSGGSATAQIATANLPAHNHVITITDNGHTHTISQSPHAHGVSDPGHAHGVFDPGHVHGQQNLGSAQAGSDNGGAPIPAATGYGTARQPATTLAAGTGIQIFGNGTGIAIVGANANIANVASVTGVTAASQNTGGGATFPIVPPFFALVRVMYTGA